jgi:hypothetical protein
MIAYDLSFNPPAPVVDVIIKHPVTGIGSEILRGKLDSGADITVIPDWIITELQINPKGYIWARGYDGSYFRRAFYYVTLSVEEFNLPFLRCITTNSNNLLLGRNVMNRFIIILDGKNLAFEIKDS